MVEDGEDAAAGTGFGVCGTVDEAGDACMKDGAGAHGAGLEGAEEGAPGKAVVAEGQGGGAEGDDLGVGGGIGGAEDLVVAAADNVAGGGEDDGSDGDLTSAFGGLGFGDGEPEVVDVGAQAGSCWVRQWRVPRPQTRSTAWMPMTVRSGKQPAMVLRAWRSLGSLKVGTRTKPLAM